VYEYLASTNSVTRRSSGNSAISCIDSSVDDDADDVTSWPPAFPFPVTTAEASGVVSEVGRRRGAGFGGMFGAGRLTADDAISINTSSIINTSADA